MTGDVVQVAALPRCTLCSLDQVSTLAHYDGKTKRGPWAFMCDGHFESHGIGLGTGKGQRLEVRPRG